MFRKKKRDVPAPAQKPDRLSADPAFSGLSIPLANETALGFNGLTLAFLGDAVYELMVRSAVLARSPGKAADLHKKTIGYANAAFQAEAARRLLPELTEDEKAAFLRGRNASPGHVPKNKSGADYHMATALEALFGYLYLTGQTDRLTALFARVSEEEEPYDDTQTP